MRSTTLVMRMFAVLGIASLVFLVGCGGTTGQSITQPPPPALSPTGVTVSPASATVTANGVQQFTATVSPDGANQAIAWSLSGTGCTGASCGMIDATGKYTAPASIPSSPTVTATATSVADPTRTATATVTISAAIATCSNPDNAKLSGHYAFLFTGFDGKGLVTVAGDFAADGKGNITTGIVDVSVIVGVFTSQALLGGFSTYSVCPDNLGTLTLNTAQGFPTDNFTFIFSFALDSFSASGVAGRGRLIAFGDTPEIGTGVLAKQDPAAFSTAAINGGYAFGLTGPQGIDENVALGRFTASGGSLSAGHIDLIGFGAGALQSDQPFTGTYSVDGSGRGEATLNISGQPNPLGLILYVVSSGEWLWMGAGGSGVTGMALQQSGVPFNASSLDGAAVFGASGFTVAGNDVTVGEVQFDGMGNLSGTNDENFFGMWFADEPISGSYTVDSNGLGRGVINSVKGPGLNVFYLVSPERGFILSGNDSSEFGSFELQTGSPFSNSSFSGSYALGTLPLLSNVGTSDVVGVLAADGAGKLSGTLTTKAGTQIFTGTYSVAANGRTTLSITPTSGSPSTLVFYFATPSEAFGFQADTGLTTAAVYVIEK